MQLDYRSLHAMLGCEMDAAEMYCGVLGKAAEIGVYLMVAGSLA